MHGAVLLKMVKSHINETCLSRVIDEVEGKSKSPNTLAEGALSNKIKSITSGSLENLIDREAPDVRITPIAKLHLQNKLCWLSEQKSMRTALMQAFEATRCAYWFCLVSFLWINQPISKVCSGINKKRLVIPVG